jgi:hypothetical protein
MKPMRMMLLVMVGIVTRGATRENNEGNGD